MQSLIQNQSHRPTPAPAPAPAPHITLQTPHASRRSLTQHQRIFSIVPQPSPHPPLRVEQAAAFRHVPPLRACTLVA
jgi:hypothetical protein